VQTAPSTNLRHEVLAGLLLAGALACHAADRRGATHRRSPPPPSEKTQGAQVRLEHLPDRDAWRVTYALPTPVLELGFVRDAFPGRLTHWNVLTAGVHLAREHDADVIVAEPARPFDEVSIEIPTAEAHPEKDYQAFFTYSGGGTLVYTGQFDVAAAGSGSELTFVPRPGERVILEGHAASGPQPWRSVGDGTYVYFGATSPLVGPDFIGVIDTGMPSWLFAEVRALLPEISALYARGTGIDLPFTPTVYMSYRRDESPLARSLGGGVLQHVMQVEIRLGQQIEAGPRTPLIESVDTVLAHEVAHFYNGQALQRESPGSDWMHEGGADAFAYKALNRLGRLSDARLAEIEAAAFSSCLVGTRLGPLHEASVPGRFKLYYWCGHLIAHITEGLGARSTPSVDLHGFWGELLRRSREAPYSEADYLSLLRGLSGGEAAEAAVRALLTGSASDIVPALLAADPALAVWPAPLRGAGLDPLPEAYQEFAGLVAATLLLRSAAGHDVAPTPAVDGWLVHGALGKPTEDLVLVELEGHPVRRRGALAYDAATETCRATGKVTIGTRPVASVAPGVLRHTLRCPERFPARPPFVGPSEQGAEPGRAATPSR
jgi:hypothetical protein